MKKRISVLLACMILGQTMGTVPVSATEVTEIYADIYGIYVKTDSKPDEDEIVLDLDGEVVDVKIEVNDTGVVITPENGYLETDKTYKLNFEDIEKEFKIKTLYFDNFDEEDGVVKGTVSNSYGDMYVDFGENGSAFYQDKKLALADAFMSISNFEVAEDGQFTFSADVEGYGKRGYKADGVSTYTANAGFVEGYMGVGNDDKTSVNGAYAMGLKNRSFKGGTFNTSGTYDSTIESDNDYINIGSITDNRFGFGKVLNEDVFFTSYSYEEASELRSMAIRKKSDGLYGLSEGVELINFGNGEVNDDILSFMADYRTVMVLDNVLVTCYIEDDDISIKRNPIDITNAYNVDVFGVVGEVADKNTWYECNDNLAGDRFVSEKHANISSFDRNMGILYLKEYEYMETTKTDSLTGITTVSYPFKATGDTIPFYMPENVFKTAVCDGILVKAGVKEIYTFDMSRNHTDKLYFAILAKNKTNVIPMVTYLDGTTESYSVYVNQTGQTVNAIRNNRNTYPEMVSYVTSGNYKDQNMAVTGVLYETEYNTTNGLSTFAVILNPVKIPISVTFKSAGSDYVLFGLSEEAATERCFYQFIDNDGTIIKRNICDYGTVIISPSPTADKEPYIFDYWENYTEGMVATENHTFRAVYKFKDYKITAEGLEDDVTVTYNSEFNIPPQEKADYNFIGYFTEADGKGEKITDEKGNSLKVYDVVGDLKVYPYFEHLYLNKIAVSGGDSATLGDEIYREIAFATDKNAQYLIMTVKYPESLILKEIINRDFIEIYKDSETVLDGYKILSLTCLYDYEGNNMPVNEEIVPVELKFDVSTDAELGKIEISIEEAILVGDDDYEITEKVNNSLTILPKLAERIEISGSEKIETSEKYIANVLPEYTTNKEVTWTVSDETVATISQDGVLTPIKNGTVTITATAKDGSGVYAEKTVQVVTYAKLNSLDFGAGVCLDEFDPFKREYTVYVKSDATQISLTPKFSGGVLRPNGSGIWISGRAMSFSLNGEETVITLNRENVKDMENSVYTVRVIKYDYVTKTDVSADGKTFMVTPITADIGETVILALFDGDSFVEMQSEVYEGEEITFVTDKAYTLAKVMVWDDLESMKPAGESEIVK